MQTFLIFALVVDGLTSLIIMPRGQYKLIMLSLLFKAVLRCLLKLTGLQLHTGHYTYALPDALIDPIENRPCKKRVALLQHDDFLT